MVVFDWILLVVFANEGGYLTAAEAEAMGDPGGPTRLGITAETLARFYPDMDVASVTPAIAREIYLRDYWYGPDIARLDRHPGVALAVFDAGVQHGPDRAVRRLQSILGVPADGQVGPQTLQALKACSLPALLGDFSAWRRQLVIGWVMGDPERRIHGLAGIMLRVDRVYRAAMQRELPGLYGPES